VSWTYTDDQGNDWAIAAKANMVLDATDGPKLGGAAAGRAVPQLAGNMRPRRAQVADASGNQRWVICYDTTAALWTTPGTTITLNYFGTDVQFESTGTTRGEKKNRRGTFQSA
jgi:hypothetical protein